MTNGRGSVLSPIIMNGLQVCLICFLQCKWLDAAGWITRGDIEKTNSFHNFLLAKWERHRILLSFVVVVLSCFAGKIPDPPWWGRNNDRIVERWGGGGGYRAESRQSILDHFSYMVSFPTPFIWESKCLVDHSFLSVTKAVYFCFVLFWSN